MSTIEVKQEEYVDSTRELGAELAENAVTEEMESSNSMERGSQPGTSSMAMATTEVLPRSSSSNTSDNVEEDYDVMVEVEDDFPAPSEEFLKIFNKIPLSLHGSGAEAMSTKLCFYSWKQYYTASQQVILEDNFGAWVACAVYSEMIRRKPTTAGGNAEPLHPFLLSNIVKAGSVSPLEFFDKLNKWIEITGATKRVKERVQKIQGSLAVSAVVYKKLLPIFRRLFLYVAPGSSEGTNLDSSNALLRTIWTMFVLLKKSLVQEDLLNCYHLLLCIIDTVYIEICNNSMDQHVNPDFGCQIIDAVDGYDLLNVLCKVFGGVLLDAKLFRTHWYKQHLTSVLEYEDNTLATNFKHNIAMWTDAYESASLKRGELDELVFLPASAENVFDPAFDSHPVELLRRGADDTSFADAELLLRISTQNCLERLVESKPQPTPISAKSYVISSDQQCPVTPLSCTMEQPARLLSLLPENGEYRIEGSSLETFCLEFHDNPLDSIACNAESMAQRLNDKLSEEGSGIVGLTVNRIQNLVRDIFYVLIERIMSLERQRYAGRETEVSNIFRKEEFLSSVFVCAAELVFFTYRSTKVFPWSLKLFDLQSLWFYKVIEIVIRSEPNLSREMVKHLNRAEEEILEELAWSLDSPIWLILAKKPDVIPSCDQAWTTVKSLSESYSPVKRRRAGEPERNSSPVTSTIVSLSLFFRKVYFLAYLRLHDLCERIRMDERGRRFVWALFERILRLETTLLHGRHLDQILLCTVYIVAKCLSLPKTFINIMEQYRHQPQSRSHVYREVFVESTFSTTTSEDGNSRDSCSNSAPSSQSRLGLRSASAVPAPGIHSHPGTPEPACAVEKVDLIKFYNRVFLPRVEHFVKNLEFADSGDRLEAMPTPKRFGISPIKRSVVDRISVLPLSVSQAASERRIKFSMGGSPRKDIQTINRIVALNSSQILSGPEPNLPRVYR